MIDPWNSRPLQLVINMCEVIIREKLIKILMCLSRLTYIMLTLCILVTVPTCTNSASINDKQKLSSVKIQRYDKF